MTAAAVLVAFQACASAPQEQVDSVSGLRSWTLDRGGLSIQLVQVFPEYVAAFYESRKLPPDLVEHMAGHCVFGTIVRNLSGRELSYRVSDWRYRAGDGQWRRIRTKTEWVELWRQRGVPYRWSLLPDDQVFAAGDWGQGFTTYEVPHGSRIDLRFVWQQDGERHEATLEGIPCADRQAAYE